MDIYNFKPSGAILLVFLLICTTSHAATYFVAPNGRDTDGIGSRENPWASLSHACSQVTRAGNTIHILPGDYTDNDQCDWAPGVNIEGAGKDVVKITSNRGTWYIIAESGEGGNQILSGITLDGNNRSLESGVAVHKRSDVTIRDCKFQYIRNTAVSLGYWLGENYPDEPGTYYSGIKLHDCSFFSCASNKSGAACDGNSWAAVHIGGLKGAELYNLDINESNTEGQCIKGVAGWFKSLNMHDCKFTVGEYGAMNGCIIEIWNMMDDSEIHHNIFNNGYVSFVNGERLNGEHSLKFHHNTLNNGMAHEFSADHMLIANNHFASGVEAPLPDYWEKCGLDPVRGGIAIWQTHSDSYFPDIMIRNNIFTDLGNAAIFLQHSISIDRLNIINNTFDNTTGIWGGSHIYVNNTSLNNTQIKNNIFMSASDSAISGYGGVSSSQFSYNFIHGNDGINMAGFDTSHVTYATPEIKGEGTKPEPYFVPIGPHANIVDAGTDVGLPYKGSAPDIGAYEYGSPSNTTPPSEPINLRVVPIQFFSANLKKLK